MSASKVAVPGLLRLGLAAASPPRANPGFKFERSLKGDLLPFDKSQPAAAGGGGGEAAAAEPGPARGSSDPFVPAKFALAGQRLTFRCYYQEGVPESALETSRKRHLVLLYHLEDDTAEIVEPEVRNNGLIPGRFLKRMRLPDISPETLRVGAVVEIYARTFKLYACDDFTRKFFEDLGAPQAENEVTAADAWSLSQTHAQAKSDPSTYHGVKSSAITRFIEASRGSQKTGGKKDLKGMFLQFDGQVLRFLCLWDDTKTNMFGEKYKYWLSYFLATQEVEVKEAKGKKQFMGCPTLLKRARLPKTIIVHDDRMRSCENVTGDEDYYTEADFRVGGTLSVFGRTMTVCDCDAFTQAWYLEHAGLDQQSRAIDVSEPVRARPELPVPPHPGFGREEDTIESWKSLIPKRPKTDMKALQKPTSGGPPPTRRLLARLVTTDPINSERVFRITLYLEDGEMSVYEPKVRNSGVEGGTFMKKQKLRREDTHEYFKPSDFVVGETVVIKAHPLAIYEEEAQPATPVADVDVIIHKLKKKILDASASLRKMFRKFDTDFSQAISFDEFWNMLNYYSLAITRYEAIVLFKAFEDQPGFMSYEMFMRTFDRAEYTVNGGRAKSVGETSRELADTTSHEELDAMIEEARAYARAADLKNQQELLLARISRSMKNSKTAQAVHDNFRRFDKNKDHLISREEFRSSFNSLMALRDNEIDMLIGKFFTEGMENLNYESFMSVVHAYADKPMRT